MGTLIIALLGGFLNTAHAANSADGELAVLNCATVSKSAKVDVTIYEKSLDDKSNAAKITIINASNNTKDKKAAKQASKPLVESYASNVSASLAKDGDRIQKATINFQSTDGSTGTKESFSVDGYSYTSTYEGIFRGESIYCQAVKEKEEKDSEQALEPASEAEPIF